MVGIAGCQIDTAIEMARQDQPPSVPSMRGARRAALLKAERASVGAKGRQPQTEAAPIRQVSELLGMDADSEKANLWLIALTV
jgi:hypothetical protein